MKRVTAFFLRHPKLYTVLQLALTALPTLLVLATVALFGLMPAVYDGMENLLLDVFLWVSEGLMIAQCCGCGAVFLLLSILLTLCTKPLRDEWPAWRIKLLALLYILAIPSAALSAYMLARLLIT